MSDQPLDPHPPQEEAVPRAAVQGTVPLTAFVGRPPMEVDLARSAPFGWWAAIVIALVAFIDRIEVNLIAGALPAIQEEFGFSDTWAGAIPTAASLAAVVLLLPAGRLADKGRRTWIVALVVLTWALFSVASGLATTFAMFFVIRILLGAAGQLYNPPASSLLADYYPGSTRGKAFGLERAGYYMGLPVGVAVGGAVAEALDWRAVFFIVAIPGVLVAALVLTVREPVRGIGDRIDRLRADSLSAADRGLHTETPSLTTSMFQEARAVLSIMSLRGITISLGLLYLGLGGLFYWLPTLLQRTEDMSYDAAAGIAGGVGGVGIVIGIILGSRIGDRGHGVKSGWRIRISLWFLLVGALSITGVVVLPGVVLRVTLVALACVGFAGAIPNLTAASADVVPAARRGLGFAAVQFLLSLGGALGPFLIGVVSDATGSINIAFLALVPPLFASVLILRWAAITYDDDARKALTGT